MRISAGIFAFTILSSSVTPVLAQEYPNRGIRLVAPFGAGGGTDVLARVVAHKLNERWGQVMVVENRPGAGGTVGADYVAKSPPDGYTLLMAGIPHAIAVSIYRKIPYDMAKDLAPVINVATFPSMIIVHPSLPVRSVKELIALAKARAGELNYGSVGQGSPNRLSVELLKTIANVNMVHVAYTTNGQLAADLMAGHLQFASLGFPAAMPMVKAGRMRAIAVTGPSRSPLLPELPTVMEAGVPGFQLTSWYGLFGPAGTPQGVIAKLYSETAKILGTRDMTERLAVSGAEPAPMAPDEFGRHVQAEIAKWAKVVREAGVRAE